MFRSKSEIIFFFKSGNKASFTFLGNATRQSPGKQTRLRVRRPHSLWFSPLNNGQSEFWGRHVDCRLNGERKETSYAVTVTQRAWLSERDYSMYILASTGCSTASGAGVNCASGFSIRKSNKNILFDHVKLKKTNLKQNLPQFITVKTVRIMKHTIPLQLQASTVNYTRLQTSINIPIRQESKDSR